MPDTFYQDKITIEEAKTEKAWGKCKHNFLLKVFMRSQIVHQQKKK